MVLPRKNPLINVWVSGNSDGLRFGRFRSLLFRPFQHHTIISLKTFLTETFIYE